MDLAGLMTTKPSPPEATQAGGAGLGGVHVTNLMRSFGPNTVVDGVSFEVPEGKVCTLLGGSGSGKTTTLRMIAGLDRPDRGEVRIGGRHVVSDTVFVPPERREVGMVFQSFALWPHMTVFDQIAYPLRLRRVPRKEIAARVDRFAQMVGLGHLLKRLPSQLSGGQQQRVAIARALVFGPRLLLLDEPLSGLDAALRRETRLELERLQREVRVTTIYVTHDQEEAMAVSDVVVVMAEGKVLSISAPRDSYDRPQSLFAAAFVGASNILRGKVDLFAGAEASVILGDGSRVFGVPRATFGIGDDVALVIKPVDVIVGAADDRQQNLLYGIVRSATYLGPHTELVVGCAGCEIRVPVPRWHSVQEGDQIGIFLPAERVSILPDDVMPPSSSGSTNRGAMP